MPPSKAPKTAAAAAVTASAHPSDSAAQRTAELAMIAKVAETLSVPLMPKRIYLPGGAYCDVDGVSADERVLVEAYAHHGKMVGARKKKVTDDALKVVTLARTRPEAMLVIALADKDAARTFLGTSWRAEAMAAWEIEVMVVDLDQDVVATVQAAQDRPAHDKRHDAALRQRLGTDIRPVE
jgi:hypothetical protein